MKSRKPAILSILAVLGLTLALAAVPAAQDKPVARQRQAATIRIDIDELARDIERAFEALDSIDGLNVRISGPRRFRLDLDIRGLKKMVSELAILGERIDRRYGSRGRDSRRAEHRRLTANEKRRLRHALRKLRALDIDIDIDFD